MKLKTDRTLIAALNKKGRCGYYFITIDNGTIKEAAPGDNIIYKVYKRPGDYFTATALKNEIVKHYYIRDVIKQVMIDHPDDVAAIKEKIIK